jgi:type IV pilus biogenesis protein CpaD/CtpE
MKSKQVRPTRPQSSIIGVLAVALVATLLLFNGCAFTTGHVDLSYQANNQPTQIAGSNSPPVLVEVSDKRTTQAVGQKINGFGMKTADIVLNSDVQGTLKSAFEAEFE